MPEEVRSRRLGTLKPSSLPDHTPLPHPCSEVPLPIAFEEPVEVSLLASSTECLSLVHQSLCHSVISTQHHDPPGPQVDCGHRAIALADLMEVSASG